MRTINYLLLGLILAASSAFAITPPELNAVYHFNEEAKGWDKTLIPNFSAIENITHAGNYAWATDKSQKNVVAFFNGSVWVNPQPLPNIVSVKKIVAGFPMTGRSPIAWAIGQDSSDNYVIDYFDGAQWKLTDFNIPTLNFQLVASAGYAWIESTDFSSTNLAMTSSEAPTHWVNLKLPFSGTEYADNETQFMSNNDDAPILYVIVKDGNEQNALYRFDGMGNSKVIKNNIDSATEVYVYANKVLLTNESGNAVSFDSGDSWKEAPPIDKDSNFIYHLFNSNTLCLDAQKSVSDPFAGKFSCVNMGINNPTWNYFAIPFIEDEKIMSEGIYTDVTGENVFVSVEAYAPNLNKKSEDDADVIDVSDIYQYDPVTNTVISTKFANQRSDANDVLGMDAAITALSHQQAIVCASSQTNVKGYFYDGKQWKATLFADGFNNWDIYTNRNIPVYFCQFDDKWAYISAYYYPNSSKDISIRNIRPLLKHNKLIKKP